MNGLSGRKILITRSADQSQSFAELIIKYNGTPVFLPTIKIMPLTDYTNFDGKLLSMTYDWLIFTSTNTVDYFFKRTLQLNVDLGTTQIAAVGKKTAKSLEKYSKKASLIPPVFTSDALAKEFQNIGINGKKVFIPASSLKGDELGNKLEKMGAIVESQVIYRVIKILQPAAGVKDEILQGKISCITFFSPSAIKGFKEIMGPDFKKIIANNNMAIAVIGPTTKAAAKELGLNVDIVPERSDQEGLLHSIIQYFK